MASSSSEVVVRSRSACFLLIYGIPGSGKSLLSRHVVSSRGDGGEGEWEMVPVHFDDFLPPDLRLHDGGQSKEEQPFILKEARQKVNICMEHFIMVNALGKEPVPETQPNSPDPSLWRHFVQKVNAASNRALVDHRGRLLGQGPVVLVVDDNLHLRSMRYHYYQLARQYSMGFVHVCVKCSASLAAERNESRPIPIPQSTIDAMEQKLETPDPGKYHWEGRGLTIRNEGTKDAFLQAAWQSIHALVQEALASPVTSLRVEDMNLKKSSMMANLDSYSHQADKLLRGCVSEVMRKHRTDDNTSRQMMARQANGLRRQILEEIRTGFLSGTPLRQAAAPTSLDFKTAVETVFYSQIGKQ